MTFHSETRESDMHDDSPKQQTEHNMKSKLIGWRGSQLKSEGKASVIKII